MTLVFCVWNGPSPCPAPIFPPTSFHFTPGDTPLECELFPLGAMKMAKSFWIVQSTRRKVKWSSSATGSCLHLAHCRPVRKAMPSSSSSRHSSLLAWDSSPGLCGPSDCASRFQQNLFSCPFAPAWLNSLKVFDSQLCGVCIVFVPR